MRAAIFRGTNQPLTIERVGDALRKPSADCKILIDPAA
jgi:hypothetical protein